MVQPLVPTSEATEPLLTLDADGIELAGLVFQGVDDLTAALVPTPQNPAGYTVYTPAVTATDDHSGYRIHHNLIRLNLSLALELGSGGAAKSRVYDNCFRENTWAVANQRQQLLDAVIERNTTYATGVLAYEIGWGLAGTSGVTLKGNSSKDDTVGHPGRELPGHHHRPQHRGPATDGRGHHGRKPGRARGGQHDHRRLELHRRHGHRLPRPDLTAQKLSAGVVVESNTITGFRTATNAGTGINVNSGSTIGASILDNVLTGNGSAGLTVNDRNTGNLIRGNVANGNALFGIRAASTATDNTFAGQPDVRQRRRPEQRRRRPGRNRHQPR